MLISIYIALSLMALAILCMLYRLFGFQNRIKEQYGPFTSKNGDIYTAYLKKLFMRDWEVWIEIKTAQGTLKEDLDTFYTKSCAYRAHNKNVQRVRLVCRK